MLGTANRILLILITAVTSLSACTDATAPAPPVPKSSPADSTPAGTVPTSSTPSTPSAPNPPPAGDAFPGMVFVRDGAIWRSPADSSHPILLFQPPGELYAAAVSRNGSIAYVPGGSNQLCIVTPGVAEPRCITPGYYTISSLAWSPDGTQVVFSGQPTTETCSATLPCMAPRMYLLALSVSSMAVRPLVVTNDGSYALGASWSPDGSVIAFAMDGVIWVVNADGSQRRLVRGAVGGSYEVVGVRWSPDGHRFTVSLEDANHCPWFCDTAVGTFEADGSGLRVIATATEATSQFVGFWPHGAPVWSPDGSRIAFGRTDCSAGWNPCREQVWVVGATGGSPQLLLEGATLLAWQ